MLRSKFWHMASVSLLSICLSAFLSSCGAAEEGAALTGEDAASLTLLAKFDIETELEYIEPIEEGVSVGLAGEDPADIARYLLASGAGPSRLSPDGSVIVYRSGVTGKNQLWTMPVTGGQPQQLTFGNGVTFFEWLPTSRQKEKGGAPQLVYGADNNGDEQESYFFIRADGSEEVEILAAAENGFRVFGGFSQDGTQMSYASTERNGLDFDIYVKQVNGGAADAPRRVFEGRYGNFVQAVSPDGRRLIISDSVGEDSDNLYTLNVQTGERRVLSQPSPRANHTDAGVEYITSENSILYATNKDREFSALAKMNLETLEETILFSAQADVDNLVVCGAEEKFVAFTTNHDGFSQLHLQSDEGIETIKGLEEGVYSIDCGQMSDTLLVRVNAFNRPGDLYTMDIKSKKRERVFTSNFAGLNPDRLIRPESLIFAARDDVNIQGLLYLPKVESDEKPPVVFIVHGGPTAQSRPSYNGPLQYLLGRGIAVFQPNVRGSTGFGRTYTTLDDRKKRLDSIADLNDMLDYLRQDGRVDADRAAVVGGSYGGYAVNAVLAEYPDAFKAGVSLFGVADWVTALEVASPALKASDIIEYGDINKPEWRKFYTEQSPIRTAHKIKVPVLFSHGAMDPRIDISETETMVRALRDKGVEAPFVRIPDEGHGWRKLSNQLFYYRRQAEFLERHLGVE